MSHLARINPKNKPKETQTMVFVRSKEMKDIKRKNKLTGYIPNNDFLITL
jgi:hypothetical protein